MSFAVLTLWVIYDHPKDYPDKFVARQQRVLKGGGVEWDQQARLAESLEEVRELIPPGLYNLGRFPNDDPVIVEVWV